jgi:hypothetical protein
MKELHIPEGRRAKQPIVEVKPSVIKRLGEPKVDYEQLDALFRRELGVDNAIIPTIRLYGRRVNPWLGGFQVPYTHTIHVQAVAAEHKKLELGDASSTMAVVTHEGQHLSDAINHKMRTVGEIALREVVWLTGISIGVACALPYPKPLNYVIIPTMTLLIHQLYYGIDPNEQRAREKTKLIHNDYKDAITFPIFDRQQRIKAS